MKNTRGQPHVPDPATAKRRAAREVSSNPRGPMAHGLDAVAVTIEQEGGRVMMPQAPADWADLDETDRLV
jgi:hypothetical protein